MVCIHIKGELMSLQVVIGAGPTGAATAALLAKRGDEVRLVSRSGTGSPAQGVEAVAADATDSTQIAELARGAQTVFNCAMPRYDSWPTLFPPINTALLNAAAEVGSDYVLVGNAYGYAPADGPITESTPIAPTTRKGRVRAQLWDEALAAHKAGRVRVTELRSSDYVGAGAISISPSPQPHRS
jgi:nucleoside-diphosphate-sugar epimerase